jgi:hypothetical protein
MEREMPFILGYWRQSGLFTDEDLLTLQVGPGGSPGRAGYYTNLLAYQANQGNGRFEMLREVDVASQRQPTPPPQVKHSFDHGAATTF